VRRSDAPAGAGTQKLAAHREPGSRSKVAAIASIVETCRRLDINLRAYLTDVLPGWAIGPVSRGGRVDPRRLESRAEKS